MVAPAPMTTPGDTTLRGPTRGPGADVDGADHDAFFGHVHGKDQTVEAQHGEAAE
jgi:hypothetical protein